MKKIVTLSVLLLAVIGISSAQGYGCNSGKDYNYRNNYQNNYRGGHMRGGNNHMRGGHGSGCNYDYEIMGTISAIDAQAETFTFIESNGNPIKVAVNPRTTIIDISQNSAIYEQIRNSTDIDEMRRLRQSIMPLKSISLSDLKAGDWVSVSFTDNTNDTVLDAAYIEAVPKK